MLSCLVMGFLPKNSAKAGGDETLGPGALVLYEHQGQPMLGLVLEARKHKYLVLNECGSELELAATRLHQLPGRFSEFDRARDALARALHDMSTRAAEEARAVPIAELWSFIVEEQRDYSSAELCELYFGENRQFEHLALRLALLADAVYFKRKKELFAPRTPEIVEELKKAEEVRAKKQ